VNGWSMIAPLSSLELRTSLLTEGRDTFAMIFRLDQNGLAEALDGPGGLEIGAHAVLDDALGDAQGLRGLAPEPLGERECLRHEGGVVHDPVDEAVVKRVVGADALARKPQLLRPAESTQLPQAGAAADAGNQPEVILGQPEAGGPSGHAQVARHGQLETAADADAVDGGDHGFLQGFE